MTLNNFGFILRLKYFVNDVINEDWISVRRTKPKEELI